MRGGPGAGVLLVALVLGGCGGESSDAPDASASSASVTTASSTPTATPKPTKPTKPTRPRSTSTAKPTPTPTLTVPPLPTARDRGLVEGADVSWPQCPAGMGIPQKRSHGAPMPLPTAEFVILGLTNGPGFYPNPCLADQVAWVKQRHLLAAAYSVISWPEPRHLEQYGSQGPYDAGTRLGRLSNAGYQQALFNVATMRAAALESPVIWLDVEPVGDFEWSRDPGANAAVVIGAARGYADAGFDTGVYSTQALWQGVVGDLALGLPEWRAAGQTSRAEALRRCGPERMFQGGSAILAQWVEHDRDRNITCPGQSVYLDLWFHQY